MQYLLIIGFSSPSRRGHVLAVCNHVQWYEIGQALPEFTLSEKAMPSLT